VFSGVKLECDQSERRGETAFVPSGRAKDYGMCRDEMWAMLKRGTADLHPSGSRWKSSCTRR
jgi:hypothetical protein